MSKGFVFLIPIILMISCTKGNEHTAAVDKKENVKPQEVYYTILGYGMPDMERQQLTDGISEKWKIKNIDVAGCVVTKELTDSVAAENAKTYAKIEKRYGKDWKVKYEKDIEDFARKRIEVMNILTADKLFGDQLKKCGIQNDKAMERIKQSGSSEIYEVAIYTFDKNYKKVDCCEMNVDITRKTVQLIQ